jgi:DNA polymerase-1
MVDSGAVASRSDAKVGMLGAMYGGTRGESGRMITRMTRRYPRAIGLVEEAARAGERGEVVHTLLGRGSPVPSGAWAQRPSEPADEGGTDDPDRVRETARDRERHRRAWGRFTRNFVVQGTGAEWALCWLAVLRNSLWRLADDGPVTDRPHLVFFLHDEVVVHSPAPLAGAVADAVRDAAAEAGRLLFGAFPVDFPLDVSVVESWADADAGQVPPPEPGR